MKARFAIALAVAAIALFGAAANVWSGTFSDDFSSGLRPTYWTVTQTTPGLFSVDDTHGDVRLAKVGTSPGGFQNVAINLNMAAVGGPISGDFSMQVDFSNAVIGPNNDQVQLNITVSGSPFDDVYDISCGPASVHVWNGGLQGCMAVTGNAGTFTISRTGGTLTGSYNGSPIFSESNSSVVPTITFSLQLQPGSNDSTSVTFDNFSLTSASVPTACVTPPSGMVGWWPGDGNANDVQDGNNGTLENGASFVPGIVAQAFHFESASSQFVQTTNGSNLNFDRTNAFSIDAWIRTSETVHNVFIAAKQTNSSPYPGYGLIIDNGEAPQCDPMNPPPPGAGVISGFLDGPNPVCPPTEEIAIRGTTSLNDGQWHLVAMTYDGSSTAAGMKLYVDGVQEASLVVSDNLSSSILNTTAFTIGSRENGGVPFQGDIDEVEVFNRVLSASEVAAIHAAGSFGKCKACTPPPPGMVSWWPGDGNANDIQDGNNGTLENGATFAPGLVDQAFSFDDSMSQFVQVPDAPNIRFGPNSPMSVDFWIFRTSASMLQHFIGKRVTCGGAFDMTFQMALDFVVMQGCGVTFGAAPNSICSGMDLPMNTWTHLAGTFDGTTMRLYINGQLVGSLDAPLGPANTAPLLIGDSASCASTGGRIDEVEIFNRALSQTEIQAIVNAGSFGKCKTSPTPTPTPTSTPTPTPTPTPRIRPTPTASPTPTATATASPTPRATATSTPTATATPTSTPFNCVYGQGYWKNHAEWPVTQLQLGNMTYTRAQLQSILETAVRTDGLVSVAHQEIAAKLNIANGADGSCITQTLANLDALIGDLVIPPVGNGFLPPYATSGYVMTLTQYNEGFLCSPSCIPHPSPTATPPPRPRPTRPPRP